MSNRQVQNLSAFRLMGERAVRAGYYLKRHCAANELQSSHCELALPGADRIL